MQLNQKASQLLLLYESLFILLTVWLLEHSFRDYMLRQLQHGFANTLLKTNYTLH